MPENWATRLEAWTGDLSTMQNAFAVTAAGLIVMLLVYWFQRRREGALRADLDWLQAEGRRQTDELARRAERIAELEPQLRAEAQTAREQALRAGQLDVRLDTRESRLAELLEERDGLTDALHRERQSLSRMERELAETRLAADKDRETAARYGVDIEMISAVLNNSFGQRQVSTIYNPLNQYRVVLEYGPDWLEGIEALEKVRLPGKSGLVPLLGVAVDQGKDRDDYFGPIFAGYDWTREWEKETKPDVIVLVDAAWNSAEAKKKLLAENPITSKLDAVINQRYLVIPFPASEAGIRNVPATVDMAGQLAGLSF